MVVGRIQFLAGEGLRSLFSCCQLRAALDMAHRCMPHGLLLGLSQQGVMPSGPAGEYPSLGRTQYLLKDFI